MHSQGYSLIELLVVIVIMSIIGVVGFINYKHFVTSQITTNAITQIQSILRLAQSNATSSVLCNDNPPNPNVSPWSLSFNPGSITLSCGPSNSPWKTYNLENATIDSIIGTSSSCGNASVPFPFKISFDNFGSLTFSTPGSLTYSATCLQSASWVFTIRNANDNSPPKNFSISKGGAVDVQ